jgi:hypothetical protein
MLALKEYFLHVSVQGYNTQDDIEVLMNALKVLLPQVGVDGTR